MSIANIKDLRDHALSTLSKLDSGSIDVKQAVATARLYQAVLNSVKSELEYHKVLDQKPNIEFLNSANIYETDKNGKVLTNRLKVLK